MDLFKKKGAEKAPKKIEEQSEEIQRLVQIVLHKYRKAYDAKSAKHAMWEKCYNAYTGDLFKHNLPEYRAQQISNYVFSTVETVIPIMVANNPKALVFPQNAEAQNKADMIQKMLDFEWNRTKFFSKLVLACRSGLIYGTTPIMLVWDKTDMNGLGNVKPVIISPFNLFPDPSATCTDDAEYMIYADYINVGKVIETYPEKADLLRKSTSSPQDKYLIFGKDATEYNPDTNILYIELYMEDYSMEVSMEEQQNGDVYKVEKRKYPNGRKIVIAGDVLLEDTQNPYLDGRMPFVLWKCYDVPGQFWSIGEVEQIISPQQSKCDITNSIIDGAKLMSNPVWIIDKNAGVEKNSLTNRQGLIVRKTPGTEVKRDAPPALPAYIQNIIEMLNQDIEHISGVYDVTRGERPTGITAAAAIESLNEQARGRIKLKVQMLEQMLGELFSMWVRRVQQFWDSKRSIRIIDSAYNVEYDVIDKSDIDGDYDVYVVAGSTMAVNKTARLQQLIQMAQTPAEDGMPIVDRQAILENADIPDFEKIIERIETMKQMQAQQQQQQMIAQQQAQMEQMAMQQAQEQMAAEQEASRQLDVSEISHMQELEKMALQQQNTNVQSEVENDNSEQLMAIIQQIAQMTPEELAELANENPQVQMLIEQLAQMDITE